MVQNAKPGDPKAGTTGWDALSPLAKRLLKVKRPPAAPPAAPATIPAEQDPGGIIEYDGGELGPRGNYSKRPAYDRIRKRMQDADGQPVPKPKSSKKTKGSKQTKGSGKTRSGKQATTAPRGGVRTARTTARGPGSAPTSGTPTAP